MVISGLRDSTKGSLCKKYREVTEDKMKESLAWKGSGTIVVSMTEWNWDYFYENFMKNKWKEKKKEMEQF